MELKNAVEIRGLNKIYNGQPVIKNLDLDIPKGTVFGLLGPNGAGKTTLMKIISGLTKPTSGQLTIFGKDTQNRDTAMKKAVGLIPQDSNMERDLTVEEALTVYARLFDVQPLAESVENAIERFNLHDMRKKTVRYLSGGMMRRALIARSLIPDPALILLDEPTVGLDPDIRYDIWGIIDRLRQEGKTLIFTTHYMEEALRLCDEIAIFRKGELIFLDKSEHLQAKIGNSARDLEELFIRLARGGDE